MMLYLRRTAFLVVCALIAVTLAPSAQRSPQTASPKLVVVIVADQMRSDYLERFAPNLTAGLQRILRDGAVFSEAAYPYLNTVTCPGHVTIGTGSFPYRHGMILNAWPDRETGLTKGCTEDATSPIVGYGPTKGTGESPRNILVPTLANQLRDRTNGRVVTMSLKARSAIGLAGRRADSVVWFDDAGGGFVTSTAFTKTPVPFMQQFIAANPIDADAGKVWDRALPAAQYQSPDEGVGEKPPGSWKPVFPHPLSDDGTPDKFFQARWKASPFADEYLGRMAAAAVDALKLGRGDGVDFLGVSFSTLDSVGHAFGPASHEVQDIVVRLDRTIGRLLDHLDATVGKDNYVVGFSSDHGVASIPEQVPGAARLTGRTVLDAIDAALSKHWGPGKYAAVSAYTDIYLIGGALDRLRDDAKARNEVIDALKALPGITHAFTADELDSGNARTSSDPVKRAAALSFYRPRSGDVVVVPRENWILSTAATTHGTLHAYDQRVPVMFFGAGIQSGRYSVAATPADLAPTLAAIARVPFGRADGRVLLEAVAKSSTATAGRVE